MTASLCALHVTSEPAAKKCTCRKVHNAALKVEELFEVWLLDLNAWKHESHWMISHNVQIYKDADLNIFSLIITLSSFPPLSYALFVSFMDVFLLLPVFLSSCFVLFSSFTHPPLFLPLLLLCPFISRSSQWSLATVLPPSNVGWAEKRRVVASTAPRRERFMRSSACRSQSALCQVRVPTAP